MTGRKKPASNSTSRKASRSFRLRWRITSPRQRHLAALFLLLFTLLGATGLFTPTVGVIGRAAATFLRAVAGKLAILLAGWLFIVSLYLLTGRPGKKRLAGTLGLILLAAAFVHFRWSVPGSWQSAFYGSGGGLSGALLSSFLLTTCGATGFYIAVFFLAGINIFLISGLTTDELVHLPERIGTLLGILRKNKVPEGNIKNNIMQSSSSSLDINLKGLSEVINLAASEPEEKNLYRDTDNGTDENPGNEALENTNETTSSPGYILPDPSLLSEIESRINQARLEKEIRERIAIIQETLLSFGINAQVTGVAVGPAITRYEIQPPPGVKVSRIVGLADDLSLALAAPEVRIEAPVPGKAAVGIEVPNREIAPVPLKGLLLCAEYQNAPSPLAIAIGRDIAGQPVIADLSRMPHLLVAGATGSGKSVFINTLIVSLLCRATPDEVKLVLIDPKRVELAVYNGIPHLAAPVVTEAKKAAGILLWAVREMERRYQLFAAHQSRDITRFNQLNDSEKLPYLVIIIDELADLMMVAPAEVEDSICRLAQMARAAGIHLVVATQRPSVDVITGLIKANIPSRIAFAVSSQTDSRTILDQGGAEKLLGKGDMLFYPVGATRPLRVQGAFLPDADIEKIITHWQQQGQPAYNEEAVNAQLVEEKGRPSRSRNNEEQWWEDELLPEAVKIIVEAGSASASLLQRRLKIGYTRAARLIDIMEAHGFIGPYEGSKPRTILISAEKYQQFFGQRSVGGNQSRN